MITPEIEELKQYVEQRYGKVLGTSNDFEAFSAYLQKANGFFVSTSTLKRLWGYVNDKHVPRRLTLDFLSMYIGYANFNEFTLWLKTHTKYNSSFFRASMLLSNDIKPDSTVEIGWQPNRIVRLRYLGESNYEVISSVNSKLSVGDRFVTGCFIENQPLYLPFLERNGERTPPFVAGRNGGLSMVNVFDKVK